MNPEEEEHLEQTTTCWLCEGDFDSEKPIDHDHLTEEQLIL